MNILWYFGLILFVINGIALFITIEKSKLERLRFPRIIWLFYTLIWVGVLIVRISH